MQSADSVAVKEPTGIPAAVTPDTIWKTYQVRFCIELLSMRYLILQPIGYRY